VALQNDAILYQFVTTGCPVVWPKKAQVGGFPGSVRYGAYSDGMHLSYKSSNLPLF